MSLNDKKDSNWSTIKSVGFLFGGIVLGSLLTVGVVISKNNKKAVDISDAVGVPLLTVDGKTWTTTDLPGDSLMEYFDLERNIYNARQGIASRIAVRLALAKDAGMTITNDKLPKIEDLLTIQPVSDIDTQNYYDQIIAKMGPGFFSGKSYEMIKSQLQQQLSQQKIGQILETKIKDLEDAGRIKVLVKPPVSPPVKLNLSGFPVRGNHNASTTLVEVADYMCAHCRESEGAIEKIYKEYSNKVKFVHVAYPLAPLGLSGSLARGAYCATEQGDKEFWSYHKEAFSVPFSKMQPPSGVDAEKAFDNETIEVAKLAKINIEKFSACLGSENARKYIEIVQKQFNENVGFSGTPTFYLNGSMIQVSPQQLASTLRVALN
ncbi:DsbA family protein [Fluviispira multicolorata]|uniref:Thioredoxin domain-containing protein n=1 Tax=Fluviispira multicolorata TaxID=2654512 RepID=A0A833JE47_9BACT|nr:thioredoxin domain-containing protein [Fluviispira multicolorata]KAB8031877.1 thioredoxin domain-containing protein [Fluviispira multicolorata]